MPCNFLDPTKLVEFVQTFTRSGKVMALLIGSPYASQSLKHLIVMLNSFPTIRKTKIHLRHLLLQNIDIIDTAMTTHGSSFLQFLLLDSYHFDGTDHEVQKGANEADTWTITNSEEWETHGGSTEYQLIETALTAEARFSALIRSQAASHLFEVLLQVAPRNAYQSLFEQKFKGSLVDLIRHPVANFVIQRLIEFSRSEALFKEIYDEVKPNLAQFFAGRSGIIVKIAHVALRYTSAQSIILQDILQAIATQQKTTVDALKAEEGKICEVILVHLANKPQHVFKQKRYNDRQKANEESEKDTNGGPITFSSLGCQLLSEFFKFQEKHVNFIFNSFKKLDEKLALALALDRQASRTFESFLLSPKVPYPSKSAFSTRLAANREFIGALALDRSGSHVLDQLFSISPLETKALICEQLIPLEKKLTAIPHGKFVLKNVRLSEFKHNRDTWSRSESSKLTRKKTFEEILSFNVGDEPQTKPKKKDEREEKHKKDKRTEKKESRKDEIDAGHTKDKRSEKKERKHEDKKARQPKNGEHDNKTKTPKRDHKDESSPQTDKEITPTKSAEKKARKMDIDAAHSEASEAKSSRKRKREEPKDDIDNIFDTLADKEEPTTVKKSKTKENTTPSAPKSTPSKELAPPEPAAPLSKLKLKKLAKAQKVAEREKKNYSHRPEL